MKSEVPGVDTSRPNPARVYDYWLGGAGNFAIDRELGDEIIAIEPRIPQLCRENRAFLRRVVHWLCAHGIEQFLDLGSGIPTVGNVHEIAQAANPRARVCYVDVEPVAVAHSRRLLEDNPRATIVQADLRDVEHVLNAPEFKELFDPREPIAVLALSVLQYFPDRIPHETLARYLEACAPGSYVAVSHVTDEPSASPGMDMTGMARATHRASNQAHLRGYQEIVELFGDAELVDPGVVPAPEWHPEDGVIGEPCGIYVGLARRR